MRPIDHGWMHDPCTAEVYRLSEIAAQWKKRKTDRAVNRIHKLYIAESESKLSWWMLAINKAGGRPCLYPRNLKSGSTNIC